VRITVNPRSEKGTTALVFLLAQQCALVDRNEILRFTPYLELESEQPQMCSGLSKPESYLESLSPGAALGLDWMGLIGDREDTIQVLDEPF
jgi:hypothetical protein